MVRAAAAITVLAIAVTVVIVARSSPDIKTLAVSVAVPDMPGGDQTIALDAMLYLPSQTPAPAVILAHGFGSDRESLDDAARLYATRGYVVLTYSARGFGASEGEIGLNDPNREVADVSRLVEVLAGRDEVTQENPEDPVVGIAGGSYGGGLALMAATAEPRLDAVVAAAAWNSLSGSLSPNGAGGVPGVLKEQWASVLFTSGASSSGEEPQDDVPCGRFDPQICQAYARTAVTGQLDEASANLLDRGSPQGLLDQVTAPTMVIAGQDDTLFGLDASLRNAAGIANAPVALRWVAGAHGEASRIDRDVALEWFDVHLRGDQTTLPRFSWVDPASGTTQEQTSLPVSGQTDRAFVLSADGRLISAEAATDSFDRTVVLRRPPGGLPASLTTLPGLGDVGAFLPTVEMQGLGASFSSPALDNDLTMLGRPGLTLPVDVADDQATLFIKLYDVSPGGRATLLQSAVNATRPPAGASELTLVLEPLAYRIVAGNRLRVTLDTTDQAYALGRNPSLVKVHVGSQAQLILPTVPTITGSPVPAAARVGLPVLGIVVLALLALLFIRRHEAGMTAEAPTHPARTGSDGERQPATPLALPSGRRVARTKMPRPEDTSAVDQVTTTDPIVVRGLVKRYDDGKVAVDGLDLTVGQGQVFGLLGPNGAGKTTTMRMLLGLILPTEGEIRLLGQEMRPGHPVLQHVGVLVEGPGFAPYLTGRQNLLNYWRSGTQTLDQADLERSLSIADLGTAIDNPTRTYSHGMRQRLAIAQALLGRPDLLILDEPTDGLDPEQIRAMRGLLGDLGKQGQTVLVSSHLLSEVEQMCTHAAVLNAGKVVAAGPVAELVGGSHTLVVQTDDVRRARDVATAIVGRTAVRPQGDGLIIQLDGVDPADVVTALVNAGVGVSSAAPRGRLEDVFLELTGTPD